LRPLVVAAIFLFFFGFLLSLLQPADQDAVALTLGACSGISLIEQPYSLAQRLIMGTAFVSACSNSLEALYV